MFNPKLKFKNKTKFIFVLFFFNVGGVAIKGMVTSPVDYYQFGLDGLCRSLGVDTGKLTKMWCEDEFVPQRPPPKTTIDAKCLTNANSSRSVVVNSLVVSEATSTAVQNTMKAKRNFLNSSDRGWRVEDGFWISLVGSQANQRVQSIIIETIGGHGAGPGKEAEVIAKLTALRDGKLLEFAGSALQTVVSSSVKWIESIKDRQLPALSKTPEGGFKTRLTAGMGKFLELKLAGKTLRGKEAIEEQWRIYEAQKEDDEASVTLKDISDIQCWSFLMDEDDRKRVNAEYKQKMASSKVSGHVVEEVKAKSKKGAKVETRAMVRNLFKK